MIFKRINLLILLALVVLSACKKDYFLDSGTHKANYDGSIYDYLVSKPNDFDSLVRIIDLSGMKDVFDKQEVTFFAPGNATIYKAVKSLNQYLFQAGVDTVRNLNQVKPEVWRQMLSLYVLEGKYKLKDFTQIDTLDLPAYNGQSFKSIGGRAMNVGVIYNDAGSASTGYVKYAGYRQLMISYITDFGNPKQGMRNAPVSSSDIQPTNGVVHVLQYNKHSLGFQSQNFILEATTKGVLPYEN